MGKNKKQEIKLIYNWYKCKECGIEEKLKENKKWFKGYCIWTKKTSRFYRTT